MTKTVANLFELQNLQLKTKGKSAERGAEIETLRKKIPASLLINFDRFMVRGKKMVSVVNHGVCSECHLQIPVGVVNSLASGSEIQRCGNCGRYLHLPEAEPLSPPAAEPAKPAKPAKAVKAPRKKELTHVG